MVFLTAHGRLVQVDRPVDPRLEITQICRTLMERQGPAVL
ncbi:MAG: UbiD family decarboxylase, partial [Magnetococcales bacterium]|nr:UbiD family decarboxylase [Magnetococcales bacterium]